jgi:hypothetical protein
MTRWLGVVALLVAAGLIVATRPDPSFAVEGNFILWDEYPGRVEGERCTGERSLYHDINSLTSVTIETEDGAKVASAELGDGRIASGADLAILARRSGNAATASELDGLLDEVDKNPCLFTFRLTVDNDRPHTGDYIVRVGRWGQITMSESDLRRPGAVQLSVGLR